MYKYIIHINYKALKKNVLWSKSLINVLVYMCICTYISQGQECDKRHLFWSQKFLSKMSQMDQFWAAEQTCTSPLLAPTLAATTFLESLLNSKEYTSIAISSSINFRNYLFIPHYKNRQFSHLLETSNPSSLLLCYFYLSPGYPCNFKLHAQTSVPSTSKGPSWLPSV